MNNARFSGSIFSRTVIANLKCLQHDSIFKITVPSIWKNFNMRYLQHNCNFNMTVFFHMTLSSTWHASTFNMTVISIWKSISSTMQYVNYDNIFTVTFQYGQNDSWISSIWHSSMRVSSIQSHLAVLTLGESLQTGGICGDNVNTKHCNYMYQIMIKIKT